LAQADPDPDPAFQANTDPDPDPAPDPDSNPGIFVTKMEEKIYLFFFSHFFFYTSIVDFQAQVKPSGPQHKIVNALFNLKSQIFPPFWTPF